MEPGGDRAVTRPVTSSTEHAEIAAADGLCFHVARAGAGPVVVLLHGFTGSTETWASLQAALATRFTTLAVDITGHGRSGVPRDPTRYSLTRFADDLRDILNRLSIPRVVVLGYSMGGRAALRFALQHPDRVAGLILESTSPGIADPAERAERVASDLALAAEIEKKGIAAFIDRWEQLPLWANHKTLSDESRLRLRTQRLANQPLGLANSLRGAGAGAEPPVTDRLPAIRTPVRIVVGARDAKYVALGRVMEASMAEASLSVVAGAGHMVHAEQPDEFRELVRTTLDGLVSEHGEWR